MLSLQHPYISVTVHSGKSYGGGQQYSENVMVRRCGCGIIAATDLLLYLSRWHLSEPATVFDGLAQEDPIPLSVYNDCILWMNRHYFPMIPYAGINGVMLMAGLQKFFLDYKLRYTARWCLTTSGLWDRIESMLRQDIPVILSAGPNFPLIWEDKRVGFYVKSSAGRYIPSSAAKAHFFTVTGMDESWLRISSWGRLYYMNRWEFLTYIRQHSISIASNTLLVQQK